MAELSYHQALQELTHKNFEAAREYLKKSDEKFITSDKKPCSEAAQELIKFAEMFIELGRAAS